MCGFVVASGKNKSLVPSTETGVKSLTHRGPDEQGTWNHPNLPVQLSQCRLSIIDLVGGSQPMTREGHTIVYNGELYNYRSLRKKLAREGYEFHTESDTEVFLNAFRHWKLDVFDRVRGMFSVVFWDDEMNRMVLARDHVGQKPLFYFQGQETFAAASEIQGLLASTDEIGRRADPASLSWYLSLGYVPAPRTGFFNVKKLPAGHYMIVDQTSIKDQVRYWDPTTLSRSQTAIREPEEEVKRTLRQAVERRLISDVPLGAFLSGGIDSSIVVGLMSELSDSDVTTVCVGFSESEYDERNHAREVADFFGTDHHSLEVDLSLEDILPKLATHFGEPFADSSAVPTYYLANRTSRFVKVALSGDGGDETFGGYRRYRALRHLASIKRYVPDFLLRATKNLGRMLPEPGDRRSTLGEVRRILETLDKDTVRQYNQMVGLGFDDLKAKLAQGPLQKPAQRGGEQWLVRWFRRFEHVRDPAQLAMFVDMMSYLTGDLQTKTDITTMMNSLECRSPFLDRDVLELSLKLPGDKKIDGSNQKKILKESFQQLLPQHTLNRSKKGFGVPLAKWFREGSDADFLESILMDAGPEMDTVINRDGVEEVLEEHQAGQRDAGPFLWAIVMMNLWSDEYKVRI